MNPMLTLKPKENLIEESCRNILISYQKEIQEKEEIIKKQAEQIRVLREWIDDLLTGK